MREGVDHGSSIAPPEAICQSALGSRQHSIDRRGEAMSAQGGWLGTLAAPVTDLSWSTHPPPLCNPIERSAGACLCATVFIKTRSGRFVAQQGWVGQSEQISLVAGAEISSPANTARPLRLPPPTRLSMGRPVRTSPPVVPSHATDITSTSDRSNLPRSGPAARESTLPAQVAGLGSVSG